MGTPFITRLEPTRLDKYNPKLPPDQQSQHIPPVYIDVMSVREAVFVQEQGCPLEYQHDADDARSCHWVMYASVRMTTSPEVRDPHTDLVIQKRCSETRTMPIGTLRIVPFPHPPHPPEGGRYVGGVLQYDNGTTSNGSTNGSTNGSNGDGKPLGSNLDGMAPPPQRHRSFTAAEHRRLSDPFPFGRDRRTDFHNGKEAYVKLGRVAVLHEFRGHHIAAQLWHAAKTWLQEHPTYFNPSVTELGMDIMQINQARDIPKWDGLVCVHAREDVTNTYERWGFKVDKRMGRFYEEGVPHVGMFQRLKIKDTIPRVS